jgi:hypothetical protein
VKIGAFIFLFLSICLCHASGQELIYDVIKGDEKIGEVVAQKTISGPKVHYTIRSKVEISVFFTVIIESTFASMYQNGHLDKARTVNKRDGKVKEYSSIDWTGEAYDIVRDGNMMTFGIPSQIRYSLNAMYFNEPLNRTKVFSERFGEYVPLKKIDSHKYRISLPGGGTNVYTFMRGYCSHVYVEHWLADVEFVLQNLPPATKS